LSDLINLNDEYPVVVLDKNDNMSYKQFSASLSPSDVNKVITSQQLQNGMILSGAVVSQEDYGYIIDLGFSKVNAFLSKKYVPDDVIYQPGRLLRLRIEKITSDRRTIQLSVYKNVRNPEVRDLTADLPLHCLIPGFKFNLMVNRVSFL